MPCPKNTFALLSAALLGASCLLAEDQPVTDADLPQPVDPSATVELLAHSPFTRSVNLEDSLQLTGIAYMEGRPVATFLNKATHERVTVSEEPNAQGWKLTEASPGTDLRDSEVHMMVGEEIITLHYGDEQLVPGAAKKGMPTTHLAKSSSGPDFRSASMSGSKGDDQVNPSTLLGEHGKELYAALSHESRDKFKAILSSHIGRHPESTAEQNTAYAQKIYSKLKASDQKSTGGAASVKVSKSSKRK
jgi:hypothetical protein